MSWSDAVGLLLWARVSTKADSAEVEEGWRNVRERALATGEVGPCATFTPFPHPSDRPQCCEPIEPGFPACGCPCHYCEACGRSDTAHARPSVT